MGVDIFIGTTLFIAGITLEVVSLGAATIPSIILTSIGGFAASSLPLSMKLIDRQTSKKRNIEIQCKNKLNEIKLIFSKVMNDNHITHEEFELVMEIKKNYYADKAKQKINSLKESKNSLISYKKNIEVKIEKQAKKEVKLEIKKELLENKKKNLKTQMMSE